MALTEETAALKIDVKASWDCKGSCQKSPNCLQSSLILLQW